MPFIAGYLASPAPQQKPIDEDLKSRTINLMRNVKRYMP